MFNTVQWVTLRHAAVQWVEGSRVPARVEGNMQQPLKVIANQSWQKYDFEFQKMMVPIGLYCIKRAQSFKFQALIFKRKRKKEKSHKEMCQAQESSK